MGQAFQDTLDTAHLLQGLPRPVLDREQDMNSRHRLFFVTLIVTILLLALLYLVASAFEWRSGKRLLPWSEYSLCGTSVPKSLPTKVRIGLYEEFPVPWRLDKLKQVDFPVTVAVAAKKL
jgi:hypothetical protein